MASDLMRSTNQLIANTKAAAYWSRLAPAWIAFEEPLEEISGEPGRLAMELLDLGHGHRVVDLGCGTGRTTLQLAERVGHGGAAVGLDIEAEMLAVARRRSQERGVCNVQFMQSDIQIHDLGEACFDRAYSRFGVMFFADAVAAFTNIRRALRPGGRLAFVCFQGPAENEWMSLPVDAAMSVIAKGSTALDVARADLFSLADPEKTRSILAAAGFRDLDIVAHTDWVVTPERRIPEVAMARSHIGPVAESLREADAETRHRVRRAIETALRAQAKAGEVRLKRGTFLIAADV
jgi:ubiquinone/menaquinone biosynthesis C-methylase UbiE